MEPGSSLYRPEAVAAYRGARHDGGRALRLSPRWLAATEWLVCAVVLVAGAYAALARVTEHARGLAVVRENGRADLAATTGGVIAAVLVRPGQRVRAGDALVRYYPAAEIAELERINREVELALTQQPGADEPLGASAAAAPSPALAALRSQRALAEARLAARAVVAPRDATVREVRVRTGQRVDAGEVLASVSEGDAQSYTVVAFLPGQYRPLLRLGMRMRVELAGYRYSYQRVTIQSISENVTGPAEARRMLGPDLAGTLQVQGPVVLVEARLPAGTFAHRGRALRFYDGMSGSAEVGVRAETILSNLFPMLTGLRERDDDE